MRESREYAKGIRLYCNESVMGFSKIFRIQGEESKIDSVLLELELGLRFTKATAGNYGNRLSAQGAIGLSLRNPSIDALRMETVFAS